jgi:hypothetical protein
VPATPVPRPPWLKVTAALAVAGIVVWPILAMLGLLGAVSASAVVNVGIVTAALAYVSIRRIKLDRALAIGAGGGFDPSDPSPGGSPPRPDPTPPPRGARPGSPPSGGTRRRPPGKPGPR